MARSGLPAGARHLIPPLDLASSPVGLDRETLGWALEEYVGEHGAQPPLILVNERQMRDLDRDDDFLVVPEPALDRMSRPILVATGHYEGIKVRLKV